MMDFEVATNEIGAVHTACEHGFHSAVSIPNRPPMQLWLDYVLPTYVLCAYVLVLPSLH